ncbi:hypothetical protein [Mesoflavibacter sp. SCSIO 43206]|uniref:hypothetical protein n=1 Tax=Mesoflavibacter sp. SCSIO 43206 TaxID=2779362 RepID=UPI001CA98371|nr:hypothetical protein [Mesoflavibacter sp. SCSIO 43206]UAB75152.1 hypothetical protein INR78_12280 [Mesoflavibacter sp. SCSIO 43206]
MKKIKAEIIKTPKGYEIPIGNSLTLSFKNKKKAEKFVIKFSQLIDLTLQSISQLNANVYTLYRQYYFQLPISTIHVIDENLSDFNDRFRYVFKEFSKGNSAFVFQNIDLLFIYTNTPLDLLKSFAFTHKEVALKNQTKSLINLLEIVRSDYDDNRYNPQNVSKLNSLKPLIKLKANVN